MNYFTGMIHAIKGLKRKVPASRKCDICDKDVVNITTARLQYADCLTEELVRAVVGAEIHEIKSKSNPVVCKFPSKTTLKFEWHCTRAWDKNATRAARAIERWIRSDVVPLSVKYYIQFNHPELGAFLQSHHKLSTYTKVVEPQSTVPVNGESGPLDGIHGSLPSLKLRRQDAASSENDASSLQIAGGDDCMSFPLNQQIRLEDAEMSLGMLVEQILTHLVDVVHE
jgi:hypothetical protein